MHRLNGCLGTTCEEKMNMKNTLFQLFITIFLCAAVNYIPLQAQQKKEQEHDSIVETVSINVVEVPVRVFHKKKPVRNLNKEDFLLIVNGKKQRINGFYEIRKQLQTTPTPTGSPVSQEVKETPKGERLFLLIFNLSDYHQDLQSLLDITFKDILRPGDRLMVLTNHYFFPEWKIESSQKTKSEIIKLLDKEIRMLKSDMLWFNRELLSMSTTVKSRLIDEGEQRMPDYPLRIYKDFFLTYTMVLEDLKDRYMNLQIDRYIKIAKYLKGQEAEKWVLNFYQVAQLPLLDTMGDFSKSLQSFMEVTGKDTPDQSPKDAARQLKSLFFDYLGQMRTPENLMVNDISKSFVNSGATFNTMLLKPIRPDFSSDYKYQSVSTDAETILKQVAKRTGGSVLNSNKIESFVKKITAAEDIVYMLTYVPEAGKKKQDVKIVLNNKDYRALYDDQSRQKAYKYSEKKMGLKKPAIEIEKMVFDGWKLKVKLKNIQMVEYDGNSFGAVQAKIKISRKTSGVVANFEKTYKGLKEEGVFEVELPELTKGKYSVVMEVKDLFALDNRFTGDAITIKKR
jgi:hypothetical protein